MAAWATRKQQSDEQQDHYEENDPEHLHPAWCAGVRGQISHLRVLGRA